MTRTRTRQDELYRRALRSLPGGTDSNFRAWGEKTIYVDRGKGGRVWDLDGNEYIDLRMGYGPNILGHADERVDDYVNERMRRGVSFSLTSEDEIRAMELVKELPKNQQEVVRLRFHHHHSYQEISDITGLSVGNVGFILNAAMRNLRNKMERDDKDEKIVYLKKTAS